MGTFDDIFPEFTPWPSLGGGIVIGMAASALLLFQGRILGISGILGGIFKATHDLTDMPWRLMLLAGMIAGGLFIRLRCPDSFGVGAPGSPHLSLPGLLLAGLLVGIGTSLGTGCTSGHGVCGLGRMSGRSLTAVITFMTVGVATATLHARMPVFAAADSARALDSTGLPPEWVLPVLGVAAGVMVVAALGIHAATRRAREEKKKDADTLATLASMFAIAAVFSVGLCVGGMTSVAKVISFLTIDPNAWDPSLLCTMGGAVVVTSLAFHFILRRPLPLLREKWGVPTRVEITDRLVIGSAIFGIGWGLAGLCPGPAIVGLASGSIGYYVWCAAMLAGMLIHQWMAPGLPKEKVFFSIGRPWSPVKAATQ
eukprot:jgi/Mesvir1/11668/Mv00063-RA.1